MRYEICPADILYSIGAYGMPTRFSHWSFGKTYHKMKMSYDFNMGKIYELVVNSNPCYAFLLENNSLLQNKLIVAHVLGHSDFFKNNAYFSLTNRDMIDTMSLYAEQIKEMEYSYGFERVENFIDAVLSIQEHVDPQLTFRDGTPNGINTYHGTSGECKDLLLYLLKNNPDLEEWQQQILHMMREEMLYFYPQMETKIMNEGWATFWHLNIMRKLDLTESETLEFSKMNAAVIQGSPTSLNPYLMGVKIFEELDRKYGRDFIFEVRELNSDVSFIRNYLSKEIVEEMNLYTFGKKSNAYYVTSTDVEQIRDVLITQRSNGGSPCIVVRDGDYMKNRELYLVHKYDGVELDIKYAEHTLKNVHFLWNRAVHLETVIEDKKMLISFDGKQIQRKYI
jgi:stage V sporulation protein R